MFGKANMAERGERRLFAQIDAVKDGRVVDSTILPPPPLDGYTRHDAIQKFEIRVMSTRIMYEERAYQRYEVLITRATTEEGLRRKALKTLAKKIMAERQGIRPQSTPVPITEATLAR